MHSEETKRKIGEKSLGRKHSLATRKRLSEAQLGIPKGPHSDEHKSNISAGLARSKRRKNQTEHKLFTKIVIIQVVDVVGETSWSTTITHDSKKDLSPQEVLSEVFGS